MPLARGPWPVTYWPSCGWISCPPTVPLFDTAAIHARVRQN